MKREVQNGQETKAKMLKIPVIEEMQIKLKMK